MLGRRGCGKSRVVEALRLGGDLLAHRVGVVALVCGARAW